MNFTIDEMICGDRFKEISDYEYSPNKEIPDKDCIIFTKTDYLNELIPKIEAKEGCNYVLISHNSDGNIVRENPRSFDYKFSGTFPKNLKKWFAQNVVDVSHENLISIIIGLENQYNYLADYKKQLIFQKIQSREIFKPKQKLLYINHNIETNPSERLEPYQIFFTNNWLTIESGKNGQGFENYLNQILNHKFVLCPFANGHDSHRIWETLLLGSIPIVKTNMFNFTITSMFDMCEVENWKSITEEKLEDFYFELYQNNEYWLSKLFEERFKYLKFSFWKDLILNS